MRRAQLFGGVAAALFSAQAGLAMSLGAMPPEKARLPAVPSERGALVESLGDRAFFHRARAVQLQHVGNLDGEIQPLRELDYAALGRWLSLLDRFDDRSAVMPHAAAFLYSATQQASDCRVLIDFLAERGRRHPDSDWRWLAQAVYLARYRLGDMDLSLALARELATIPVAPMWAKQLQAFILIDMNDRQAARAILQELIDATPDLPEAERKWTDHFIKRHLR